MAGVNGTYIRTRIYFIYFIHVFNHLRPHRWYLKSDLLKHKILMEKIGGRAEGTKASRQEMVDRYVGKHQDGAQPGQLLQVGPVSTWASLCQALPTLAAFCPGPWVGSDSEG